MSPELQRALTTLLIRAGLTLGICELIYALVLAIWGRG